MKTWIYIILLIRVYSGNLTCVEMYRSGKISEPCVDYQSCCFLNYTFQNNIFTKCYLKKNMTDDICGTVPDTIGYYGAETTECFCQTIYIKYALINLILLVILLF